MGYSPCFLKMFHLAGEQVRKTRKIHFLTASNVNVALYLGFIALIKIKVDRGRGYW